MSADAIQALYADLDDLARVHSERVAEIRRKIEALAGESSPVDVLAGYEWARHDDLHDYECYWAPGHREDGGNVGTINSARWFAYATPDPEAIASGSHSNREDGRRCVEAALRAHLEAYPHIGVCEPFSAGPETGEEGKRCAEAALRNLLEARR